MSQQQPRPPKPDIQKILIGRITKKELLEILFKSMDMYIKCKILVLTDPKKLNSDENHLREIFLEISPDINPQQQPRTPTETIKPTPMELLTRILGDPRLVEGFMNLCKTNIHERSPDDKKLLAEIWLDPRLFSEYVRLVSIDERLLTPDKIVLRNRFLQICPNIPNLL